MSTTRHDVITGVWRSERVASTGYEAACAVFVAMALHLALGAVVAHAQLVANIAPSAVAGPTAPPAAATPWSFSATGLVYILPGEPNHVFNLNQAKPTVVLSAGVAW
jgi:hypothetical protein